MLFLISMSLSGIVIALLSVVSLQSNLASALLSSLRVVPFPAVLLQNPSRLVLHVTERPIDHSTRPFTAVTQDDTNSALQSISHDDNNAVMNSRRRFLLASSSVAVGWSTTWTSSSTTRTTTIASAAVPVPSTRTTDLKFEKVQKDTDTTGISSSFASIIQADAAAIPVTIQKPPITAKQILQQSAQKAISGGKAGATASVIQVLSLMWLRTSMNYQYRYGGTLGSSLKNLYQEGGVGRLYQGLPFALIQGPLTRFGDTAANVGILALLDSIPELESLPLPVKTACGSICAGLWRIVLMPVDTSKTVMQVEGREGLDELFRNVKENGVGPLYRGALASAAATAVGHFPWFLTYNFLNDVLPPPASWVDYYVQGMSISSSIVGVGDGQSLVLAKLVRSAVLGFSASCVSDVCSNSLRVIKTTKQTAGLNEMGNEISYKDAVSMILEKDGWNGLFGRGLSTRLLTNAIQGAVFSVFWRYFQEMSASAT